MENDKELTIEELAAAQPVFNGATTEGDYYGEHLEFSIQYGEQFPRQHQELSSGEFAALLRLCPTLIPSVIVDLYERLNEHKLL